jgi:hypothetical protein
MTTPMTEKQLKLRIRAWLVLFIVGLALSGITAFPIETELAFLVRQSGAFPAIVANWITAVYNAVHDTNSKYPYLAYGTDWLAFGHLVIATTFIGPLKDPVRNIWVLQFGMIACVMVFPLAFIAGPIRGIPVYWRFIDCSFGFFGIIPLWICYRDIRKLERLQSDKLAKS